MNTTQSATDLHRGDLVNYDESVQWGMGIVANVKPDGVSVFFTAEGAGLVWFELDEAAADLNLVQRAWYAAPGETMVAVTPDVVEAVDIAMQTLPPAFHVVKAGYRVNVIEKVRATLRGLMQVKGGLP